MRAITSTLWVHVWRVCVMASVGVGSSGSADTNAWGAALAFAPCSVAGHATTAFPSPADCVSGSAAVGYEFGCCHVMSAYASRATGRVIDHLLPLLI